MNQEMSRFAGILKIQRKGSTCVLQSDGVYFGGVIMREGTFWINSLAPHPNNM